MDLQIDLQAMAVSAPNVPLPKQWPEHIQSAFLHSVAFARKAFGLARGYALNSSIARARLAAENATLKNEVAMLQEELRLLRLRFGRIAAAKRPHYQPVERLAILMLKAAQGWSLAQTARRLMLAPQTVANWLQVVDAQGQSALLKTRVPVNRFPDFVSELIQTLKATCPHMGKVRITDTLARAGMHLSATTVARMLKRTRPPPRRQPRGKAKSKVQIEPAASGKALVSIVAKGPDHIWHADLTTVSATAGFWVPWFPFSMVPWWPFASWLLVVVDHASRKCVGVRLFHKEPSSEEVVAALESIAKRHGRMPKHLITDRGSQFGDEYRQWCTRVGIEPRFGAVGQHGSICITERFIRSLKYEWLHQVVLPLRWQTMVSTIDKYVVWYNEHRPHRALGGATPHERYAGVAGARAGPRWEVRERFPLKAQPCAQAPVAVRGKRGGKLTLVVESMDAHRQLPIDVGRRVGGRSPAASDCPFEARCLR